MGNSFMFENQKICSKGQGCFFTAFYDESLTNPESSKETFVVGANYTDQAVVALNYIKQKKLG